MKIKPLQWIKGSTGESTDYLKEKYYTITAYGREDISRWKFTDPPNVYRISTITIFPYPSMKSLEECKQIVWEKHCATLNEIVENFLEA